MSSSPADVAAPPPDRSRAALAWALFVSPKAVFAVHPFVRALVELLVFASATMALWDLGFGWAGLVFGVVAVAIGVLHGRRALA